MFDTIREQFFPVEIVPGIHAQPMAERAAFWAAAGPLMDAIFPPFATLGAFAQPDKRWPAPLAEAFGRCHHE